MLARGVLYRLAADVPKTSTHDLPRISQLLRTTLFARNGASQPTIGAIAHAFRSTILEGRRAYATKSATQPTTRVKKAVKKAVAKTAAPKKPTKKPAAKKAVPKKPAAKKKKAAPKKAARRPKKVLTAEEKEAATIKDLKKRALRPPKPSFFSAWSAFAAEALRGAAGLEGAQGAMRDASAKYKELTPAEREHYNHVAKERTEAARAEFNTWIHQHTPEDIRAANFARATLRRKLEAKGSKNVQYRRLEDDRRDTSSKLTPYIRFSTERIASGDLKGIAFGEKAKLIANEWKALNASEKKKYQDAYDAAKAAA
ncbi:hypothetical protein BU23DRAFT_514896 [Bimuria novae-zelandiae CBS 107.79]|uniref:HMG box domain-containing protein n=1 Tax=Bimuria novae-zelandiae CBS 107.79 TaxID=1447943 RepID=A0A6A5UX59_9PLEO|nr:hypothetical protein BU23DRAFT_514896 [Bimuria novae-zelandiae CBS 107.79]